MPEQARPERDRLPQRTVNLNPAHMLLGHHSDATPSTPTSDGSARTAHWLSAIGCTVLQGSLNEKWLPPEQEPLLG